MINNAQDQTNSGPAEAVIKWFGHGLIGLTSDVRVVGHGLTASAGPLNFLIWNNYEFKIIWLQYLNSAITPINKLEASL